MNVRNFNGSNARLGFAPGASWAGWGTMLAIVKPDVITGFHGTIAARADSGTVNQAELVTNADKVQFNSATGGLDTSTVVFTTAAWQLLAMTKANGTATPRFHRWLMSSGVGAGWTHGDGGAGTSPNYDSAAFGWYFGFYQNAGWWDGEAALGGCLSGVVLSDGQFEGLDATQDLINLGASTLWEFNQAAAGDTVTDLTGNGANSNLHANTTITTGVTIPNWTFGLAPVGGGYIPRSLVAY